MEVPLDLDIDYCYLLVVLDKNLVVHYNKHLVLVEVVEVVDNNLEDTDSSSAVKHEEVVVLVVVVLAVDLVPCIDEEMIVMVAVGVVVVAGVS